MQGREVGGILMAAAFSCGVFFSTIAFCDEGRFYITEKGAKMWEAPSRGWKMCGIGTPPMEVIRWANENKPPDVQELKGWEVMAHEPGERLAFGVKFGRVQRPVFTKDTKIIVTDKQGNPYESEALLFWPDEWSASSKIRCRKEAAGESGDVPPRVTPWLISVSPQHATLLKDYSRFPHRT